MDAVSRTPRPTRSAHDWVSWGTSSALLAAAMASVSGSVVLLQINSGTFAVKNTSEPGVRALLAITLASAMLVALFLSLAARLFARPSWSAAMLTAGRRLGPLIVCYPLISLVQYSSWRKNELSFLVGLAVTGLLLERTLRLGLDTVPDLSARAALALWHPLPARLRKALPLTLVSIGAAGFAGYVAYFALMQHQRLATSAFDLGIYDNLMYTALSGKPFRSPVLFGPNGGNYLAGHAELGMLLFVPLYALHPSAETLIVLQSVMLGFAAVPLYLFAATLIPRATAVLVAYAYLLYAPLHGPAFYDFHWLPLAIFFHFWLYFAIAREKKWLTGICLAILISIREDVSVGLTLLGIFLVVTRVRPRLGALIAGLGVTAFLLLKFVLMPWAGQWWFAEMYKDLVAEGEKGYGSVILTLVVNPIYFLSTLLHEDKLTYFLHLFAPLLFLPLRRPALVLLGSAGFFFTLMTTGYAPTLSIAFQYTTHWIPYVFAASVIALHLLYRSGGFRRLLPAALALALVVTVHSLSFGALLQRTNFVGGFARITFKITEQEQELYANLQELLRQIPNEASVAATENLVPHISSREIAYTLRVHHGKADFLLLDRSLLSGSSNAVARRAFEQDRYGLVAKKGRLFLFKLGHESEETEAALRELGMSRKKGTGK